MSQENVELVVKQFERTNARDFAGVMDTWADDLTRRPGPRGRTWLPRSSASLRRRRRTRRWVGQSASWSRSCATRSRASSAWRRTLRCSSSAAATASSSSARRAVASWSLIVFVLLVVGDLEAVQSLDCQAVPPKAKKLTGRSVSDQQGSGTAIATHGKAGVLVATCSVGDQPRGDPQYPLFACSIPATCGFSKAPQRPLRPLGVRSRVRFASETRRGELCGSDTWSVDRRTDLTGLRHGYQCQEPHMSVVADKSDAARDPSFHDRDLRGGSR